MSPARTLATASRVLRQLSHDPRTLALVLLVPALLLTLLRYLFDGEQTVFTHTAPIMLSIFPVAMMFLVTSIATLRERKSGTLDRLLTMPIAKLDFILGYAIAFSILGLIQALIAGFVVLGIFNVDVQGSAAAVMLVAVASAFLGTTLGLFVSAFATTEFQAVQLIMPLLIPQVLLCGLFVARDKMADILHWISNILPLTYAVDAMMQVANHAAWTSTLTKDLLVVLGYTLAALILASATIRRRS
jgi:ABC-2 type transport system permease protein